MSKNTTDELREQLAAIEHERWADWQKWVHKCHRAGEVEFTLQMIRWERQINTPYAELSDQEKASDMEQVDRYWHLIEEYISNREKLARIEEITGFYEWVQSEGRIYSEIKSEFNDRLATLRKELDGGSDE